MHKIIFKYHINHGQTEINLPIGSEILCFREQAGHPRIWVLQEIALTTYENRLFHLLATGETIFTKKKMFYIGTVVLYTDEIYHLFELKA